jgi:hypothetical protein
MEKERKAINVAVYIVAAFIVGAVVGYFTYDLTNTGVRYQFYAGENILLNSGFEEGIDSKPVYWQQASIPAENLTMFWDSEIKYNGNGSISIHNTHIYDETVHNNWYQNPKAIPIGYTIELSGWIKTVDAESVNIAVSCLDENFESVAFGTTEGKYTINGTTDWQMYKARAIYVPYETEKITVMLMLTGTGQVWFDDVQVVVK